MFWLYIRQNCFGRENHLKTELHIPSLIMGVILKGYSFMGYVTSGQESRVVRAARLWRKVAVLREFEAWLRHAVTGKLSLNPAVNGYLFLIREG